MVMVISIMLEKNKSLIQYSSFSLLFKIIQKAKDFNTFHLCLITQFCFVFDPWTSQLVDVCLSFLLVGFKKMIPKAFLAWNFHWFSLSNSQIATQGRNSVVHTHVSGVRLGLYLYICDHFNFYLLFIGRIMYFSMEWNVIFLFQKCDTLGHPK